MTRRIFCKVLLVVVAIFGLLVLPSVLMAQGRSEDALEHAKAVQEKHTDILMARPGVVGTAVGLNDNGQYAVLVLLERPGVGGIPQELESVPVQVVVTGKILALVDPTARFPRPVPTGVSTGHPDITAGTIGCRVTDGTNVYALSNNHVYAVENYALIGDNVLQPGTYDGGIDPDDAIGTLAAFEPIVFSRRARNEIDAAIATVTFADFDEDGTNELALGNATPADGYGTPNSEIKGAFIGQQVQKFGRTTKLTTGEVTGVNATVNVGYGPGKTAKFVKQILIGPGGFSDGGDSGSLIVTNDESCNPVGLLFAGSSTVTVANRIDLVLDRFNVTVDGDEGPLPTTGSISGTVTASDETGAIAGATVSVDTGQSATTGINGDYAIANVPTGNRLVTASADGFKSQTKTAAVTDGGIIIVNFALDPVTTPATKVDSIVFSSKVAGPNMFLYTTVKVVDGDGNPIDGVWVEMTLMHESAGSWDFAGNTGTYGTIKFTLGKALSGDYEAVVTNLAGNTVAWYTLE